MRSKINTAERHDKIFLDNFSRRPLFKPLFTVKMIFWPRFGRQENSRSMLHNDTANKLFWKNRYPMGVFYE